MSAGFVLVGAFAPNDLLIGDWDRCGPDQSSPILSQHTRCDLPMPLSAVVIVPMKREALREINRRQVSPITKYVGGGFFAILGTGDNANPIPARREFPVQPERELWRLAQENLDKAAAQAQLHADRYGIIEVRSASVYESYLVFSDELWNRKELQSFVGRPAFKIVDRYELRIVDSANYAGVNHLDDDNYFQTKVNERFGSSIVYLRNSQFSWTPLRRVRSWGNKGDVAP